MSSICRVVANHCGNKSEQSQENAHAIGQNIYMLLKCRKLSQSGDFVCVKKHFGFNVGKWGAFVVARDLAKRDFRYAVYIYMPWVCRPFINMRI